MDRRRLTSLHGRALAGLGLVALVGVTPLGCSDDTIDPGNETGGDGSCPLTGALVISEVVANVPGADAGLEWFEIYNASGASIDLQGLTLVYAKTDGTGRKTHTITRSVELPAGGYAVVGSMLDELVEGMPNVDYGYANVLGEFGNTAGYLAIECDDIIDEIYYVDASENASRTLSGFQAPDAIANDDLDSWCDSKTALSPEFAATPRAANDLCGGSSTCLEGGDLIDVIPPAPGELVITEVHPNPAAAAEGDGEWFEIHSLATTDIHLNNLQIAKTFDVATKDIIAVAECLVLSPGEYAVIAGNADSLLNGALPPDTLVWESKVAMSNSNGARWIGVDEQTLDAVTWDTTTDGASRQLDPDFFDPLANDDLTLWCKGTTPYGDGDLGTPGAPNAQCPIPPPDGQCYENGELRDITPVDDGDLEITEFLANPQAVDDGKGEWFEVLAKASGDLNGLQIGKAGEVQHTVDFGDAPGFGGDECITVSPGDHVVFAHSDDPLVNGGMPQVDVLFDMAINNSNSDLFVRFEAGAGDQATWTTTTPGHSKSKDALGNWCDGAGVYGDGDEGTPGEANPMCEGGGNSGMCTDPDTMLERVINPPLPGQLTISELMPDPAGAPDASGEWFELHAHAAFDLNGLELGKNNVVSHVVSSDTCIEVADDSYIVFARTEVDADNCALPSVDHVYAGLSLSNSNGSMHIGLGGLVFDEYSWSSVSSGKSLSYDPMSMEWCDAVAPFGCGDLGTPGDLNPACDGGGNNEGMCMDGMVMREIVNPSLGDLVISEFMANPDAVSDANGEWFEIRALAAFDLNGVELGRLFADGPLATIADPNCLAVAPGDSTLIARNGDNMVNGGLPAVDVLISFGLTNSNSALYAGVGGVLLDQVTWVSVATGASTSLDPDNYDDILNDPPVAWCPATTPYGLGDLGSPGADNQQCQ
ncbi:hypothetical protein DB30_00585 [Enhygromyxa salina]|uniref:LTD domain-containing protein n=1 Tax=Enhygromyxa salina TaxID=215803 RepID=A0A0C2CU29_9BACT|nr:lamin tail domain-containing protein [Enhygromyxa salina]KIG13120.1 hypothetical protein DB30_00585 [Enhygromyxa salina]